MTWTEAKSVVSKILTWFVRNSLIIAATALLLLSVTLALLDKMAAASLLAGLFVVLTLFHYLPQMESFKAYGIEAKWRARLNEAEDLLQKLRQSALASARLTYHTLGWGSRFGGKTAKIKQSLSDETEKMLLAVGFDQQQLNELKRDYIFFTAYDIFQCYQEILQLRIQSITSKLRSRLNDLGNNESNSEVVALRLRIDQIDKRSVRRQPYEDLQRLEFSDCCYNAIPAEGLTSEERATLTDFAKHVSDIVDDCKRNGRISNEAAELVDSYGAEDRKKMYRRFFQEDPLS